MKEKVLLALSDANLSSILKDHLTKLGHTVDSVSDGNEVISKMKGFKPELLLIDTVLPNKSGYDVLNEKSFDKDVTKIPVIIISNAGEPIQMRQIPSTPVIKDYVVKAHVDPLEVEEKIEKVFGREMQKPSEGKVSNGVGSGKKILWVEDDRLLSTILSKKIESTGFTLLKANKDEEAFKILETETPNAIVLDIMLPGMNGFEILQKIKMEERLRKVPVMMLSNLNKQSDLEKAKVLGANKFLVKAAVSLDEIINEVALLINSQK